MRHLPRIALLVALIAIMPVLAGCENFDPDSLDPFGLNKKKPLPGHRELLFPEGVPGVSQGIPQEYRAGNAPAGVNDLPPGAGDGTPAATTAQTAAGAPTKPVQESNLTKPKPKPARRVVRRKPKPKPQPKATETAAKPKATTAPWPSTPRQTATQQGTSAPWPSSQPQQSQSQSTQAGWPSSQGTQEQRLAPWPSAPPSDTFSKQ